MVSGQDTRDRHEDEHEHDAERASRRGALELEHDARTPPTRTSRSSARRERPSPRSSIPRRRARRDAAMRLIRRFGDPVLRARALPVERFDEAPARGAGADGGADARRARGRPRRHPARRAAPRARVPHRPRGAGRRRSSTRCSSGRSEELEMRRRGLPQPARRARRGRAPGARARARAATPRAQELEIEAEGLRARVIQHEIDHLDGVLILDRISAPGAQGSDARDARGAGRPASAA